MIAADEFRQYAEELVEMARALLVEQGFHKPIALVFTEEGPPAAVGFGPMPDHVRMNQVLRQAVRRLGGKACIFIGESWVATEDPATLMAVVERGVRVKDIPGRGEALTVFAAHPAGKWLWQIPFSREGGRLVFGKVESIDGVALQGGMAEILATEEA